VIKNNKKNSRSVTAMMISHPPKALILDTLVVWAEIEHGVFEFFKFLNFLSEANSELGVFRQKVSLWILQTISYYFFFNFDIFFL
jgi:hypothetical protein